MITVVTMIWTGRRQYTLVHAAIVAAAIARDATFSCRFVVLSDQVPASPLSFGVMPPAVAY